MIAAKQRLIVELDDLPTGVEPCRDENCPVIGLHEEHVVYGRRGRLSRSCPNCFKQSVKVTKKKLYCRPCGWQRPRKEKQ